MFDWNDLKHFLAVARSGSTLAAAKKLALSQSTVQRRLTELERRIGQPLIKRHSSGYRLTPFGAELLPHAERVEQSVLALEQYLKLSSRSHDGSIHLTCPEPIGHRLAQSNLIERFHEKHPDLRIELMMCDKYLDLASGEADVAIRAGDGTDDSLVGRKVAHTLWALYAGPHYIERHGAPRTIAEIDAHAVVSLDGTMAQHRAARWLEEVAPHANVAARSSSVLGLLYAVKSGAGVAPLPMALAEREADIVRLLGPIPELTKDWWLLTLPEFRRTPRIVAFFDFIATELDAFRQVLTGGFEQGPIAKVPEASGSSVA